MDPITILATFAPFVVDLGKSLINRFIAGDTFKPANIDELKIKNQELAKSALAESDWSVLPDVNITNKSEFEAYRGILRGLVISPVVNAEFPVEPTPVWQ